MQSLPVVVCFSFTFLTSCFLRVQSGYLYPHPIYQDIPVQPPQFLPPQLPPTLEDVPDVSPTYLPSVPGYPPPGIPAVDVQPPLFDTPSITETDDSVIVEVPPSPPQYLPPSNQYLPPTRLPTNNLNRSIRISNLSCVDSTDATSKFYAQFSSTSPFKMIPNMEDSNSSHCLEVVSDNLFRIRLEGPSVKECGVKRCISSDSKQKRMCVTLRMATVRGIRLPEDLSISVQCIPQPTVMAHTKELRFKSQNSNKQRSLGNVAVASGGTQRKLDVSLNLFRKSTNSIEFNEIVRPDTAVFLGEELLLRAAIKNGNGYANTRMDSVVMRSSTSQQTTILVDENGCTNPSMRNVCPDQPRQISPLVIVFPFRAFLFQGSENAEEMVLSMRMIGCLNSNDCLQINRCSDSRTEDKRRITRSVDPEDEITDGELRFKVLPFVQRHNFTDLHLKGKGILQASPTALMYFFLSIISIFIILISLICFSWKMLRS